MSRQILYLALICTFFCVLNASAAAAEPAPKTARLSLVTQDVCGLDQKTADTLDDMVERAMHIPFGSLMGWLVDVDEHDLFAAYDAAYEMNKTAKGSPDYPAILRMTADVTDADLAVLPILETYGAVIFPRADFGDDDYIVSRATVRILVYDRRTDEVTDRRVTRSFHGAYAPYADPDVLAYDAMRVVIDEAGIKQRVKELSELAVRERRYGR